ncbi:RpiB/LacA/LacB family sugar-phosphate isomerase [Chloroflexota bacterium]
MRIAVGSDSKTALTDHVVKYLEEQGHVLDLVGALKLGDERLWPYVGYTVAQKVVSSRCDTGIAFCWTGTGVCIAANKVRGVRAALCWDVETTRGARLWNDANILVISLRYTSIPVAEEILKVWLAPLLGERDEEDRRGIALMSQIETQALGRNTGDSKAF